MQRINFKPLVLIGLVVLGLAGFTYWSKSSAAKEIVHWRTDYPAAKAEAKNVKKPLLLYFTASWCPPCQAMKSSTFADPAVDRALQKFVYVKVDVDENPGLAGEHNVSSIPTFHLMNEQDQVVMAESGYIGPEQFIAWLEQANSAKAD